MNYEIFFKIRFLGVDLNKFEYILVYPSILSPCQYIQTQLGLILGFKYAFVIVLTQSNFRFIRFKYAFVIVLIF
jgi:hypothetical protein